LNLDQTATVDRSDLTGNHDGKHDVREAYATHSGELYGFAVRALGDDGRAEEAVQETFLRAWRVGGRLNSEDGGARGRLFAILREVVLDLAPAGAARDGTGDGAPPSAESLQRSFLTWRTEEAMRRIGDQHRRVLVEVYYRARPYAEVATELDVTVAIVKSRVYDGLRALTVALEELPRECEG
jgi:RNA polymerase sigma-70 factor, ECF subfamily